MKKKQKKTVALIVGSAILIALIIWAISASPKITEEEVLSRNGLHAHSMLTMYVAGEKLDIPGDIGLGATHQPVHTHDPDGTVHLEFSGRVLKEETVLGEFFKNWNKDMRSFGANMRMVVNGTENTEYENYHMRDGDTIELYYE